MIDIVLVISGTYFLQNDSGEALPRGSQPLLPSNYFVVTDGPIDVTEGVAVTRTESDSAGIRIPDFKDPSMRAR
jgi:hypothetical protein